METTPTTQNETTKDLSSLTNLTDVQVRAMYPGRTGVLEIEGFAINIRIKDARKRFGHLDFLVTPTGGLGERWIQSNRIKIHNV
jgi:hypothetical protein